jgi:hypothetical protein
VVDTEEPVTAEYDPGEQREHELDSVIDEYVPTAQLVHEVATLAEYIPASQLTHCAALAALYLPPSQSEHELEADEPVTTK